MLGVAAWIRWLVAALIFLGIAGLGLVFIRGIASSRTTEKIEPEDVADLDVFFVCRECGTEFQVTKLGEVQVPRHCGEPMMVVRRPRQQTVGN